MKPIRGLFAVLIFALLLSGCFWGKKKEDRPRPQKPTASVGATKTTTSTDALEDPEEDHTLSKIFSIKNKLGEVRYLYEHGQEAYAVKQAEGLLSQLKPNSRNRLELHFLMARCYERLGEHKERKRHDKAFRDLLEQFGKSKEHQQSMREGKEIRQLIDKSIAMAEPTRPKASFDEDDIMFNVRCARRLQRVSAEQVIHENLAAGQIYYSRTADEVKKHVASASGVKVEEVVVQRDPRFGFYFCIIEEKL